MTPIELMALVLIVVSAIKIIVILAKPKTWVSVVKKVWATPFAISIISLILAILVFYYLLQELTIVQIFAVMLFVALLAAVGVVAYSKEVVVLATKLLKDRKIVKRAWLSIAIWIILIIWVLIELFA